LLHRQQLKGVHRAFPVAVGQEREAVGERLRRGEIVGFNGSEIEDSDGSTGASPLAIDHIRVRENQVAKPGSDCGRRRVV